MADKDDYDIEQIDQIDTGDEGKLVDDNYKLFEDRSQPSVKSLEKADEGEETAESDEEHDEEGDVDGDNDNDIEYTNAEGDSQASSKEGFIQKMKRKIGIRPKIHNDSVKSSILAVKYIPPPAPPNMPRARDAARARVYRSEKVRYGKGKMSYYLDGMHNQTLNIDDLVMKSEQNVHYVKGI